MSIHVDYVSGALATSSAADLTVIASTATTTWLDDGEASAGVREPRRPVRPSRDGAIALDLPDTRDIAA